MIKAIASFIIVLGLSMSLAGGLAVGFIASEAREEMVVTAEDSSRPNRAVIGPLEMKAQADIIEHHTLDRTDGLRYAEMDRENEARPMWITATVLRTALHFGLLSYAFAFFVIVVGLMMALNGAALWGVAKRA